jgi:hypothetical protein
VPIPFRWWDPLRQIGEITCVRGPSNYSSYAQKLSKNVLLNLHGSPKICLFSETCSWESYLGSWRRFCALKPLTVRHPGQASMGISILDATGLIRGRLLSISFYNKGGKNGL